jgi:DNA-binding NtrC family response regulator
MNAFKIMIIDDEVNQRKAIKGFLSKKGYFVIDSDSWLNAIKIINSEKIDLILTDYKMPDKTGEDVVREMQYINPLVPVIVMTAYGTIETAVSIMKNGAFDFIQKPIDLLELLKLIEKAKNQILTISENNIAKKTFENKNSFNSIVTKSSEMDQVINTALRVAQSKASLMIRGESGTGKELIARAVHDASNRAKGPFIVVNCAAMPESLFESELFGHEKGAFTGADKQRIGKFEMADKGTLFIDEVGDIPSLIQVKLLRAVQFGQIERLGGKETLNLDVRILTATNRNLEEMIKNNEFREDLFYRFNVVTLNLPPLRERKIDIPLLIEFFIKKYSDLNGKDIQSVSSEALDSLLKYDYPGNIRELENIIQRAVILTRGDVITTSDLPGNILTNNNESQVSNLQNLPISDLNQTVENIEKELIINAINQTNGNQTKAAQLLNITERTLRYKLSKYKLKD